MDGQPAKPLTPARRTLLGVLGILLAGSVPGLTTLIIQVVGAQFQLPPFLFLYIPGILFIAYLTGLVPGTLSAALSTLLALYFLLTPTGLDLMKISKVGLPASLFLLTGTLMALTGDQYRRYQAQLREDLRRSRQRERHEALLIRVTDALTSGLGREKAGERVCWACTEVLGDRCAIVLAAAAPNSLSVEAFAARDPAQAPGQRERLEQALAGTLAAVVREAMHKPEPVVDAEHAALLAPIRLGEENLGCLLILADRSRVWDARDRRVAQSVADRVALAIDQRRRAAHRLRRERDARVLSDVMSEFFRQETVPALLDKVVRRCTDVLGEWCALNLFDSLDPGTPPLTLHHQDPSRLARLGSAVERTPLSQEHPLTKAILERNTPTVIAADDPRVRDLIPTTPALQEAFVHLGIQSLLAVPIYVGGEALGILAVGAESARDWDDEDVRLISALADRSGAAIQNIRLLESERQARANAERESRRVLAVNRVIAIAAGSLDPGPAFDEFAEALQMLLPFVRVTVSLHDPERDWLTMPYFKGPTLSAPPVLLEGPKTGTVRGWVIDHGRAYVRKDTRETQEFAEDRLLAESGIRSYVVVPMIVRGHVVGTLNFGHHEPGFYTERHASLVQPIADQLAITISHFQLFDQAQRRAGELSATLQHALLPAELPKAPFTAIAAVYRPADAEARIGGDWYDAVLLPDDSIMVSIGDVTGRGLPAAAEMAQVRHVVRAYALEGRPPSEILRSVNDFLCRMPTTTSLSMWVGVIDPYRGTLLHAGAGHPPPYVCGDGQVDVLETGGPPLGYSALTRYHTSQITLAPGTRLIAYTDGLIEVTHNVVEGERRLKEAVRSTRREPPERATIELIERVLNGAQPEDDIAVLILDCLSPEMPLTLTVPASPENLRRVRRAVRAFAERNLLPGAQVDAMIMAVGEAALNVVEHAYGGRPGRLGVQAEKRGEVVTITVRDFGQWKPPAERGRGRGARIMQGFADNVRTHTGPGGTTVELSWMPASPSPSVT